jgi:hypothetical protein
VLKRPSAKGIRKRPAARSGADPGAGGSSSGTGPGFNTLTFA